jgi:integrase
MRGLVAFPASPDTVTAFLAHEADGGAKASTIGRRTAAVGHPQNRRSCGPDQPRDGQAVMRGIRRTIGTAPEQKAPATADVLAAMLSHVPTGSPGQAGPRPDRPVVAAALRRSELVALNVEDLAFVAVGLRVTIRHAKTDQDGKGTENAVPHGRNVRPVDAVRDWPPASRRALFSGRSLRRTPSVPGA